MGVSVVIVRMDGELAQAFAVRRAVFVDEQGVPEELEYDAHEAAAVHLLARMDGRSVGTLRVRRLDDRSAKIERVAVVAAARGRGVGRALIEAALRLLDEGGVPVVRLHAQTHALGFYAGFGFEAQGPEFVEDGILHRAMERRRPADAGMDRHGDIC